MITRHRDFIIETTIAENSWLFNRNSRLEIQKLIFLQTEEILTPRLHNHVNFYDILSSRIDELIERHIYSNPDEVDEETSVPHSVIRHMRVSRKKSVILPKDEEGSVPLSRIVNVVNHQSNNTLKKYFHNRTILAERAREESNSSHISSTVNLKKKESDGLIFLNKLSNKRMSLNFSPDEALCNVYGYKNVYIKADDDVCEIFIPVKRYDYEVRNEVIKKLPNKFNSMTEYSGYESSSIESRNEAINNLNDENYGDDTRIYGDKRGSKIKRLNIDDIDQNDDYSPVYINSNQKIHPKLELPGDVQDMKRKSNFTNIDDGKSNQKFYKTFELIKQISNK